MEQRAEDRRRNARPVEAAGVEQHFAHRRIKGGNAQRAIEKLAIHIREGGKVFIEGGLPVFDWRVEHLEQLRKRRAKIGTVLAGARFDKVEEDVPGLENASVVGEQAEREPDEKALEIVALVAHGFESVVELANQLGRLDVRRVLITEGPALHAEDEAERLHMLGQFRQGEGDRGALVEVAKLESLEVAQQDEARAVALGQGVEVIPSLFPGHIQIAPGALLFDQQNARPEQVDEAGAVAEFGDMRLVTRHRPPPDAEYLEEVVVEALGLALLVGRVAPGVGELGGAGANFVPGQAHQIERFGTGGRT
ncbi:MAG: hypothetical protein OXE80_06475 [Gammaproteobacteria bacterium]|nr:hypothetical protein [Gammaproteobacteria bacterium]